LRELLHEAAWAQKVVEFEYGITRLLATPARHIAPAGPRGSEKRDLAWCAAALQALDRHHTKAGDQLHDTRATVPAELGGGEALFLAPPLKPIEDLIPEKRRLGRSGGDLQSDLHEILDLQWRPVFLDFLRIRPQIKTLDPDLSGEIARRLKENRDLRIGLASPFGALDYEIDSDQPRCHSIDGIPYRFSRLAKGSLESARDALGKIVEDCAREQIDLLCFPELTLDTDLLHSLAVLLETRNDNLHPLLVVAGTFHLDAGAGRANRCQVLDGFGRVQDFEQDKCTPYRIPGAQVLRMSPAMQGMMGLDGRGGYEDIRLGETLLLIECALGRLALPICLDYCGEELRDLLVKTQTNFLAVSAMTPRMGPFYSRARELGTLARATSIVTNSAWLLRQMGLKSRRHRAFAYIPARRGLRGGGRKVSDDLALFTIRELSGLS
jgi:predicted amidohydrolase